VKYLEPYLKKYKERLLIITGDLSASKIILINKNFDASYKDSEDNCDILLSSDKISEGFNLNRAGLVINYDIPWNPVRVIQRVGRINRISKKVFDDLFIVNFFPTEKGAELVKSREIASNKMFLIHNTLGEDSKIFDIYEEPSPSGLFNKIQTNPDKLEEESFYTKALKKYIEIKNENPDPESDLSKFPPRIKVAKQYNENELIVFMRKGRMYINIAKVNEDGKEVINSSTFEEVFEKIECSKDEKGIKLSDEFWELYEKVKNYKGIRSLSDAEKSLEMKSVIALKSIITRPCDEVLHRLSFLRTLLEDINSYGTLSDFTLRRISNLDIFTGKNLKPSITKIEGLRKELGDSYLDREKEKHINLAKEIIIAIENVK